MVILAIDSGNSYIKWGLYEANQWVKKGKVHQSNVSLLAIEFKKLFKPQIVVVSHVGRAATRYEIANIITSLYTLEPNWIVTHVLQHLSETILGYRINKERVYTI